jgi:hypothetical protein
VCVTLPIYFIYHDLPLYGLSSIAYAYCYEYVPSKTLLHHAILRENIDNDTQMLIRMKCYNSISVCLCFYSVNIKTYQHAFLALLLRTNNPSDDVKKCQQAFLEPLPGMALVKRFY